VRARTSTRRPRTSGRRCRRARSSRRRCCAPCASGARASAATSRSACRLCCSRARTLSVPGMVRQVLVVRLPRGPLLTRCPSGCGPCADCRPRAATRGGARAGVRGVRRGGARRLRAQGAAGLPARGGRRGRAGAPLAAGRGRALRERRAAHLPLRRRTRGVVHHASHASQAEGETAAEHGGPRRGRRALSAAVSVRFFPVSCA